MGNFSTWALKLIILVVVLTFVLLSLFSQPVGDDFCNAAKSLDLGFWNAQVFWYQNHTGRYFGQAVISIYPWVVAFFSGYKFAALILFVVFLIALSTFLRAVGGSFVSNRKAHWGALGLLAIYLTRMPSPVEGFYWLSGSINYTLPCVLLLFLLSLMVWPT